jgi:hypothetical protein
MSQSTRYQNLIIPEPNASGGSKSKTSEQNSKIKGHTLGFRLTLSFLAGKMTELDKELKQQQQLARFEKLDRSELFKKSKEINAEIEMLKVFEEAIIKKEMLPNLKQLREEIRKTFKNDSDFPTIGMYITLIEGAEDDRTIPCNYYVLITFDDSIQLNVLERKGLIIREFISKKEMPASELERVTLLQKEKEDEKKRLSKEKIKKFNLPTKVEPKKVEPKAKTAVEDTKANRTAEYNKAIEKLESLLERKLITKKQFSQRFDQLGKNLKDGGEI